MTTKQHDDTTIAGENTMNHSSVPTISKTAHRGVALMLVVIAVAAVTVVSLGYLAARSTDPNVGANVESGAKARAVAESGVDLITAMMECDTYDWRTVHTDGILLEDFNLDNGTVSIAICDSEGNPPTSETQYAMLMAKGNIDGMAQYVGAAVYAQIGYDSVDIDLSEFSTFASDYIIVEDGVITVWSQSPLAKHVKTVRLGTNRTGFNSVIVSGTSNIQNANLYVSGNANKNVLSVGGDGDVDITRVNVTDNTSLPIPDPPSPDIEGLFDSDQWDAKIESETLLLSKPLRFNSIEIGAEGIVQPEISDLRVLILGTLYIHDGGRFIVDKNMDLIVMGDLAVTSLSGLYVENDARLRLFVGGNMLIDEAALGINPDLVVDWDNPRAGLDSYQYPGSCAVYRHPDTRSKIIKLDHGGRACAVFYLPNTSFSMKNESVLYGVASAKNIGVQSHSIIMHDPMLDPRTGYTNEESLIYSAQRTLEGAITEGAVDLNQSTLDAIATWAHAKWQDNLPPNGGGGTPRNLPIERKICYIGAMPKAGGAGNFISGGMNDSQFDFFQDNGFFKYNAMKNDDLEGGAQMFDLK